MNTQTCNRCGQKGHYRVDCPEKLKDGSSVNTADTRTCYRCNQPGHIARDCTGIEIKKLEIDSEKGNIVCWRCHQKEHTVYNCNTRMSGEFKSFICGGEHRSELHPFPK